jgi:hypothetical protein
MQARPTVPSGQSPSPRNIPICVHRRSSAAKSSCLRLQPGRPRPPPAHAPRNSPAPTQQPATLIDSAAAPRGPTTQTPRHNAYAQSARTPGAPPPCFAPPRRTPRTASVRRTTHPKIQPRSSTAPPRPAARPRKLPATTPTPRAQKRPARRHHASPHRAARAARHPSAAPPAPRSATARPPHQRRPPRPVRPENRPSLTAAAATNRANPPAPPTCDANQAPTHRGPRHREHLRVQPAAPIRTPHHQPTRDGPAPRSPR